MANWQRGSLFLKGTKDKLASVLFHVMNEDVSIHGFSVPGVLGAYISGEIKIDFSDSAKLEDGSYIYETYLSNRGSVEVNDFVKFANAWGVDVYVNVVDPWGGTNHELLIQNGMISTNKITEIE